MASWILVFNSLRPSDDIWRHRSGSTLAQVMACCQGWGQFNSGIGIAAQFQFRNWNWNWNWNWWNWKWNWNWKPWNWNWNWNWKPELNFFQLLPQQLLVNKPFPYFSFNRRGHNLPCDWLLMQQVFLGHCPPVVWSQKIHSQGTLFPLSRQRPDGLKMVTMNMSLPWWTNKQKTLLNRLMILGAWCEIIPAYKFQSHSTDWYLQIFYDNLLR